MKTITLNKTSGGIVIGRAYRYEKPVMTPSAHMLRDDETEKETGRFLQALLLAEERMKQLADSSGIFTGHLLMLRDPMLISSVEDKINKRKNAELALYETMEELAGIFEGMEDEYMKERAADVRDVCYRIMGILKNEEKHDLSELKERVIVIAQELVPSDTARMDARYIIGIVTELGGATSHAGIIARQKGIPAMTGVSGILEEIRNGELLIMNAPEGQLILSPDSATLRHYELRREEYQKARKQMEENSHLPAITTDGQRVNVCANVGSLNEMQQAQKLSSYGIGLFRSEFLYMEKEHFPTEEEQFLIYRQTAEFFPGEVIIRTLDIGGDKELPYYRLGEEKNPYLGWRGIRISLELTGIFKTQLRAILRAGYYGRIKLMFPMITSLEELKLGKLLLEQCKQELKEERISYDETMEVGIMIETPAAVIDIEDFAEQVDFFSIGTNDLTQYLLATDRNNPKTSGLYNSFHPAVLRSIQRVIAVGQKYQRKVGMCGELACDPRATKLMLGMGLKEFSVPADTVADIKSRIRRLSYEEARAMAEQVLKAATVREVMELL